MDTQEQAAPAASDTTTPTEQSAVEQQQEGSGDQQAQQDQGGNEGSNTPDTTTPDEKEFLLRKARLMGLNPSNNAKPDTIRAMIQAKLDGEEASQLEAAQRQAQAQAREASATRTKTPSIQKLQREQYMRLVRVSIANLDPRKADLQGEIFTVANKFLGTVKVFVPYGEKTEGGWHIPYIVYMELKKRKYLQLKTTKERINGLMQERTTQKWVSEFSIELMEPLTPQELGELAQAQLAAGSIGN